MSSPDPDYGFLSLTGGICLGIAAVVVPVVLWAACMLGWKRPRRNRRAGSYRGPDGAA